MSDDKTPWRGAACAQCAAVTVVEASETVVADRLAWSATIRCPSCGDIEMQCGWDVTPERWRDLVIRDAGSTTIRADPAAARPFRARLLSVFRRSGATIAESVTRYQTLTGPGITGTPAEMKLLAARLAKAGATVTQSHTDR